MVMVDFRTIEFIKYNLLESEINYLIKWNEVTWKLEEEVWYVQFSNIIITVGYQRV
jgi:hypothetical protein